MLSLAARPTLSLHRPRLSASPAPESYVTHIAHLPAAVPVALSVPASRLTFLDPATLVELAGWIAHSAHHEAGISSLKTMSDFTVLTSGRDGSVSHWDYRTPSGLVESMVNPQRTPLLSSDFSDGEKLVVAGTELRAEEVHLLYWDIRNASKILHQHSSTHSDDITTTRFYKSNGSTRLLTGSTDGLLCISNPLEDDEDECVLNVANWGASISKTGLVPGVAWSLSDMETLAFWDEELSPVRDLGDIRIPRAALPISNSLSSRQWKMDYVVDVLQDPSGSEALLLLGGNNAGNVGMINIPMSGVPSMEWHLEGISIGHDGVVRCAHWDNTRGLLFTGGEDSFIHTWRLSGEEKENEMDVDPVPRKRDAEKMDKHEGSKRARA